MTRKARLQTLIDRMFMRLSKSTRIDGLWVGALSDGSLAIERVVAALSLIRTFDQLRYRRILHDLQGIWATVLPGVLGQYDAATSTCRLDGAFVLSASTERVASVIVHEATHARLGRYGYAEAQRSRLEKICLRRERAFAKMHPGNEEIVSWLSGFEVAPADYYSNVNLNALVEAGEIEQARELGIPLWFVAAAHKLRSVRARLAHLASKDRHAR